MQIQFGENQARRHKRVLQQHPPKGAVRASTTTSGTNNTVIEGTAGQSHEGDADVFLTYAPGSSVGSKGPPTNGSSFSSALRSAGRPGSEPRLANFASESAIALSLETPFHPSLSSPHCDRQTSAHEVGIELQPPIFAIQRRSEPPHLHERVHFIRRRLTSPAPPQCTARRARAPRPTQGARGLRA